MRGRSAAAVDGPSATVGITGSLVVHVAAVLIFFVVIPKPVIGPPVYAVELVAAPLPTTAKRVAPEAVTRPPEPRPAAEAPAPAPHRPSRPRPRR